MEITKIKLADGTEYSFANESGNTRNGFYHLSVLLNKHGNEIGRNKVNYLNRTWECYRYQSSMKGLVCGIIEDRKDRIKANYKANNGISRMTKKHKEAVEELINADEVINNYKEIYEKL